MPLYLAISYGPVFGKNAYRSKDWQSYNEFVGKHLPSLLYVLYGCKSKCWACKWWNDSVNDKQRGIGHIFVIDSKDDETAAAAVATIAQCSGHGCLLLQRTSNPLCKGELLLQVYENKHPTAATAKLLLFTAHEYGDKRHLYLYIDWDKYTSMKKQRKEKRKPLSGNEFYGYIIQPRHYRRYNQTHSILQRYEQHTAKPLPWKRIMNVQYLLYKIQLRASKGGSVVGPFAYKGGQYISKKTAL